MDLQLLNAVLARFESRGDLIRQGDAKPRLRSSLTGSRAVKSKLPKNRLRDLAIAAGIPGPDSGEIGAWQDSDADRVLVIAFTDEGVDRHGTVFPADEWTFDNFMRNPSVFLNHWGDVPIGVALLVEEKRVVGTDGKKRRGFAAHVLFSREDLSPEAEMAYRNTVAGRLRGASHSFDPKNVRLADAAEAKKYGIPELTPLISADLLEVSVVTIGSNPNVGPGRDAMLAEARAIAGFRTAGGEALLSRAALERVYTPELVAEAVPAAEPVVAVAKAPEWAELERCAAAVTEAVRQWAPVTVDIEDAETVRTFEPHLAAKAAAADPLAELQRILDAAAVPGAVETKAEAGQAPVPVEPIIVNGVRFVPEPDAETVRRRQLLRDLAARCLTASQETAPPDLRTLLQIPADQLEQINGTLQALREQVVDLRRMLAAMDPLGSSAGGPLASRMLGEKGLRELLELTAKATADGQKVGVN